MEIREYLRMLRHGWPVVLLIMALSVGAAVAYLSVAPKQYDASTTLLISAANMRSINDLQQGSQFAKSAAITYAEVIDSVTVLGDVADQLRPQSSVEQLADMVTVVVPPSTSLVEIGVSGTDREQVAVIANAVGRSAVRTIPDLERTPRGTALVEVQQLRRAVEPVRAASPNVKRTLAIGLVIGLCLGLAVTIVAQTLDNRIRRVQEVRQLADVPLLATLPRLKRRERRGLIVRERPNSDVGEAFRALRTNINFLESTERRSLLVTAVANDSGGAQVSANLAWTLAQTGQRIVLVDLDLRRSAVGDALSIASGPGMSDVLAGETRLIDVIRPTDNPHLSVVLSGTSHPSPSELLSGQAMPSTLDWMERHYDHVILHAPPLLSYTDGAVIAVAAGGTLVTVTAGSTRAAQLTTALASLAQVRVDPLGLVLTQVPGSSDTARVKAAPLRPRGRVTRSAPPTSPWDVNDAVVANGSHRPTRARPLDSESG